MQSPCAPNEDETFWDGVTILDKGGNPNFIESAKNVMEQYKIATGLEEISQEGGPTSPVFPSF